MRPCPSKSTDDAPEPAPSWFNNREGSRDVSIPSCPWINLEFPRDSGEVVVEPFLTGTNGEIPESKGEENDPAVLAI
jgi:hypothetical protein